MFTPEQMDHYNREGYVVYPDFISGDGLASLKTEIDRISEGNTKAEPRRATAWKWSLVRTRTARWYGVSTSPALFTSPFAAFPNRPPCWTASSSCTDRT